MRDDDGKFTSGFKDGFEFVAGGANRFLMGGIVGIITALILACTAIGAAIFVVVLAVGTVT